MAAIAMDYLHKYAPVIAEQLTTVNATTAQNQLYGHIDFDQLSYLERNWAAWYIWVGNPIIATGLMSFLMHEVGTLV
jgi:methylsterol monooxygenase